MFEVDMANDVRKSYGEHLPKLLDLLSGLTKNIASDTNDASIQFMHYLSDIEQAVQSENSKTDAALAYLDNLDETAAAQKDDQKRLSEDLSKAISVGEAVRDEMRTAREAMAAIAGSIKEMRHELESVERFSREIKMIAINASIASARAGDAGREFSIISGEVRRLANDTEEITKRLGPLVNDIFKEVSGHAMTSQNSEDGGVDVVEQLSLQNETLVAVEASLHETSQNYLNLIELNNVQQTEKLASGEALENSIRGALALCQTGDVIRQQAETVDDTLQTLKNFLADTEWNTDIRSGVDAIIGELSSRYVMYSQRRVHSSGGHEANELWDEADDSLRLELF